MQMHHLQTRQRAGLRQSLLASRRALWFATDSASESAALHPPHGSKHYTSVNDLLTQTKSTIYAQPDLAFAASVAVCEEMSLDSFPPEVTYLLRCPVSSAISTVVIKSDQSFSRFPQLGQVVGVSGTQGLFVVMEVDRSNRIAQLMEKSGKHRLIQVPFARVRTFNRNLAQAIHRFLDSREDQSKQR